ncbi:hypothetical protein V8C35DRAFT_276960 [Trichoderma chlorosporum]
MAESTSGSQSSDSTSDLPSVEELLRGLPISTRAQEKGKQRECHGDETIREGSVDKGSIDKGSVDKGSIDKGSVDKGSVDNGGIDKDSISSNRAGSDKVKSGKISSDKVSSEATNGRNNDANMDSISKSSPRSNRASIESTARMPNNGENNATDFDRIPPLTNTAAAIFVPITNPSSLLSPPQFVPGSSEYHRAALNIVNNHEASVRNNIQELYQREMLRINREAEAHEPSFDYIAAVADVRREHDASMKHDLDSVIANMRERDNPAADYNIRIVPPADMDQVPVTYVLLNSPREAAARDVMKVIAAASQEISSFDNHVRFMTDAIRMQMQAAASREKQQSRMDID